jgi:putative ABC transport system permease protein
MSGASGRRPPRRIEALLARAASRTAIRDCVIEDLREEYADRESRWGRTRSVAWYVWTSMSIALRLMFRGDAVQEDSRGRRESGMGALAQDLKYGARGLRRSPGFTTVAAMTLAIGVAATVSMFAAVDGILLAPLPYASPESLYRIDTNTGGEGWYGSSVPEYFDLAERIGAFEAIASYTGSDVTMGDTLTPQRVRGVRATASLLPLLGVEPLMGRYFTPGEDAPATGRVVVLSHSLWVEAYGGRPDIIGSFIPLFGQPYEVVGVMPEGFAFPDGDTRAWFPMGLTPTSDLRNNHYLAVVGRLRDGATEEAARAQLDALVARSRESYPAIYSERGYRIRLRSLHESVVGDVRVPVLVAMGAVVLVLLIACVNVANLFLTRGEARKRELATRTALGASRGRLVRQLLVESLLLSVFAGAIGIGLSWVLVKAMVVLAPPSIPRLDTVSMSGATIALAFGIVGVAGMAFGALPALTVAHRAAGLAGAGRGALSTRAGGRVRRALVISQVAFAGMLAIATGLMLRTMHNLRAVEAGFDARGVLTFAVSPSATRYPEAAQRVAFWSELTERLRALPGVVDAGATTAVPLSNLYDNLSIRVEGRVTTSIGDAPDGRVQRITPEFFSALGLRLVRGRVFTEADRAGSLPVVIVSETFASRFWPGQDPIGRKVKVFAESRPWMEVVGEVADLKHDRLDVEAQPMWYVPIAQAAITAYNMPAQMYAFVRTSGSMPEMVRRSREVVHAMDPTAPVWRVRELQSIVEESVAGRTFTLDLLQAFGLLALFLACVGVYGVTMLSVSERKGEIGLRKALGARAPAILRLIAQENAMTVGIGAGLGILGGIAVTRLMAGLFFGVSAADPRTIAGSLGVLCLTAVVAAVVPAVRALRVEAAAALRGDA